MSETTTKVEIDLNVEDHASTIVQRFRSEIDKLGKAMARLAKVNMPDIGSKLSASPAAREAASALQVHAQTLQTVKARAILEGRASRQRTADARAEAARTRMFDAADVARLRDRMAVQGRLSRQQAAETRSADRERRAFEAATMRGVRQQMAEMARVGRQRAAEIRAADREQRRTDAAAERDAASSLRRRIAGDNWRFRLRERQDRQERQERARAERETVGRGRDTLGHGRDAYSRLTRPPAAVAAIAAGASTVATRRILTAEADVDAAEIGTRIYGGLDAKAARTLRDQWAAPLAEELGTAPHQLLTGWIDATRLGIAPEGAKTFAALAAKTSAAWEVPLETVNDTLGTLNTILTSNGAPFDPKRLQSVANTIQHLSAKQSTTPERMLEFMRQGAGGAQVLGMSLEGAAAFGSASTSLGNRPGESGRMLDYLAGRVVELPRLTKKKGDEGKQARNLVAALGYGSAEAMDRKRRADPDAFLPDLMERFGKIKDPRKQEESIRFFTGREWLGEFGRMVKGLSTYKEAVNLKKEAQKLDAIGEVWNLHRTKLAFVGKQFRAGWLNILGEFGKVASPMAREAGDVFLSWSAQLRAGGLAARFKAAIAGLLEGLGFRDLKGLLEGVLGKPGQGTAGAIESWRAAARGFGQGIRDVGEIIRGAFRMVSGGSSDPEVIGRWTSRILALSAALVIASPAISILGGLASALLALGSAAVAVSGFVRMLGTVGAAGGTAAGLRLVAARLVTGLFGGIGLGIVAEIGSRRGEIVTLMLGAMKSLWDSMLDGIKSGIAEWRADGFWRGIARFLDPRLVDDPSRRDEKGHYKVEPGAEQSAWTMFWDWLKGQQAPAPGKPEAGPTIIPAPVAPPAKVEKQSAVQDWRGMIQPAGYTEARRPAAPATRDERIFRALERIAEIRAQRAERRDDGQDGRPNLAGLIRPASLDQTTELRRAVDKLTATTARVQLASLSTPGAAAVGSFTTGSTGTGLAGVGGHGAGGGGLPHPGPVPGWYGKGSGSGMPDPGTGAGTGPYKPMLDHIAASEGTANQVGGGYNTSLGYGRFLPGGQEQNLTGKTLNEILALGDHMRQQPGNPNSSALGRYQIVGATLRDQMRKLGLKGDEKFDEAMQDRIGAELIRQRGASPDGLRNEWASLTGEKNRKAVELAQAIPRGASTTPGPREAVANVTGGAAAAVDVAKTFEGMHEVRDNAKLKSFVGREVIGAQNAWCAGFVNSSLRAVGLKGTGSAVANSFLGWGQQVDASEIQKGDVAVEHRNRGLNATGGHVGIATGNKRLGANGQLQVEVIQGNSDQRVKTEWEDASKLQIRRSTEAAAAVSKVTERAAAAVGAMKPMGASPEGSEPNKGDSGELKSTGWQKGWGSMKGLAPNVPKTMENRLTLEQAKALLTAPGAAATQVQGESVKSLAGAASPPTAAGLADTIPAPATRSGDTGGAGQGAGSGRAGGNVTIHQTINGAGKNPQELANDVQRHVTEAWNYRSHDLEPELT